MEIGSKSQQSLQQEKVCLHDVFSHTKLYFATEYTPEGSYGDGKLSVLTYNTIIAE